MKSARVNQMINMPEGLILEMENLRSEVHVLRRTAASKSAAVAILHKQLAAACVHQAETTVPLQHRQTQTDGGDLDLIKDMTFGSPERSPGNGSGVGHSSSSSVLAELLSASKRENKALKQDLLDLRCKLHDAQADLKVVRSEAPRLPLVSAGPLQQHWHRQERLHLIHSLEELTNKVSELEGDVRCLNVEREELVKEREHSTATITRLGRQLREMRQSGSIATVASYRDDDSNKDRRENINGKALACLTNGIGDVEEGVVRDGSSICANDEDSSSLILQNRNLQLKLKEAEIELKRTKAVVSDYELLSSLQAAAHHEHRLLKAPPAHLRCEAGTAPSSSTTLLSNTTCASQPVSSSAASACTVTPGALAHDSSTKLPVMSDSAVHNVDNSNTSADASSRTSNVISSGQPDPRHDAGLPSAVLQVVIEDVPPAPAPAGDETSVDQTSMDAATRNESSLESQEDDIPHPSDRATFYGNTETRQLDSRTQTCLSQEIEQCGNSVRCRNKPDPASPCNVGEECQNEPTLTDLHPKSFERVSESKAIPLQSISAQSLEGLASLRSQNWLSGMDDVSGYSPYSAEGLSISDCIEEIVPIDEIDSYVEEVRRAQSKQAACKRGSSPPQRINHSSTHYGNSHLFQEADPKDGKELNSLAHDNDKISISDKNSIVVNPQLDTQGSESIEGGKEASCGAATDSNVEVHATTADDAFSDYDSDDDNFEAELQQWQQSAVGLLNQAQKKGPH